MAEFETIAAVDLGSNSFHCQIARVDGDHTYPLDSLREPVRLAAGLDGDKLLDEPSQTRAIACLQRFGERLRSFHAGDVRALGTNALRVAKNSDDFLKKAQNALGFPIEIIAGREEARLIYLGVSNGLPQSNDRRLVVDIGGGSTEFIVGEGYKPLKLDSLYMGCVSYSMRFFADGKLTKRAFREAELAARTELQHIAEDFSSAHWRQAVGSSGTARALLYAAKTLDPAGSAITAGGLDDLRAQLLRWGNTSKISFQGVRDERSSILPGGLAIMAAVFDELNIKSMTVADGALREGILLDMLGRSHHRDPREATIEQFKQRYRVDESQARRVTTLALGLYKQLTGNELAEARDLTWAAQLHEIGISVAYAGYHKHSAYIVANADMPGFTREEQQHIAELLLVHRRSLKRLPDESDTSPDWRKVFALRLAVLFCQRRRNANPPIVNARAGNKKLSLSIEPDWLANNPLTNAVLHEEIAEWAKIGYDINIRGLADEDDGSVTSQSE